MDRTLSLCARVLIAALTLTAPAYAATIYVSPSGSDSNPGSLAAPFATPARALAVAVPGDTVLLRGGTYTISRTLDVVDAGLTLRSYSGERARIVAGTTDLANLTSVVVVWASNVTVENVDLQGASYYGIKVDDHFGPQSGIKIRGLYVHHTGRDGIKVQQADGVVVENCEVAFTGVRDASNAEGIDVMGSIGATIRGNHVHDVPTTGIFVKAGTQRAMVEGNRVERSGHAGILLGSESAAQYMRNGALYEASDSTARNNIVVDAALAGLGSIAGDNIRFENNTVINAARSGQAVFRAAANEYATMPRNILLKNNVFVLASSSARPMVHLNNYSGGIVSDANVWYHAGGSYKFWRDATGSTSNNYWTSLAQWRSGMNADWTSKTADPLLDAARLFRPAAGSPVTDAGQRLADVPTDYSGVVRPQGVAYDIGAHEVPGLGAPPAAPKGLRVVR